MVAIRLRSQNKFQMSTLEYNLIRGILIDNARKAIQVAGVADLTDNSTGTGGTSFTDVPLPSGAFNATSAGGAQTTGFNTSLGKINNAFRVLTNSMNNARGRLGMPLLVAVEGTQAAKDTVAALDLSVTTTSGATSADYASASAAMTNVRRNLTLMEDAFQHLLDAVGNNREVNTSKADFALTSTMTVTGTVTSSADGTNSLSKADCDLFLAAVANNIATLAKHWNEIMVQAGFTALTDNSAGTAATALVANAAPAAVAGAATTSAPKAGFDTQLAIIANALASLNSRMNAMRIGFDYSTYTDNTAGTVSTTLAAISNALSAVDGSSGTSAVDVVSATTAMTSINNSLSSLCVGINDLANLMGLTPPVGDAPVGTASLTLAVVSATGTGVGGAGLVTMLNTAVNTWLGNTRSNIATLAAALNAMVGTNAFYKPLSAVAG